MFDWISNILGPIEWVVSWILVQFHSLFTTLGMPSDGGVTWGLSIVGLVVVIRILIIPLFVRQIRAQRGLQLLQPRIKELQKKHKNDRQRQSEEMMKLYKETGTNPLSSCLPILAQAPIFFALFRVLNGVATDRAFGYFVGREDLVDEAAQATIFGAPIAATFLRAQSVVTSLDVGSVTAVHVVAALLIVAMSASMFVTQRQLMTKNMPAAALEGPFAQQQKIMLYLFPVIFLVTGVNFPIGVLIYWTTTNIWSMGQQLYVIARMPAPGSVAEQRLEAKRAARAARRGGSTAPETPTDTAGTATATSDQPAAPPPPPAPRQRQQPKRQPRGKRKGSSPAAKRSAGSSRDTPGAAAT